MTLLAMSRATSLSRGRADQRGPSKAERRKTTTLERDLRN